MGPYPPWVELAPRAPANQQSASGVGVSTPCGTVSTRGTTVFVLVVLQLEMHGRISDPRMGPYPPRVALAPRTQPISNQLVSLGFPHRAGQYTGDHRFRPRVALWLHGPQPISNQQWSWGFHTMRSGINPRDHRFRPRCVGVADVRKDFCSGDGILSFPGGAGSKNSSQSAISQWGWGFHTVPGGIDPGDHRFRPRFVGVDALKDL